MRFQAPQPRKLIGNLARSERPENKCISRTNGFQIAPTCSATFTEQQLTFTFALSEAQNSGSISSGNHSAAPYEPGGIEPSASSGRRADNREGALLPGVANAFCIDIGLSRLTSLVMGTSARQGRIKDIVLGIIGAVVGGFTMNFFGKPGVTGFNVYSMLVALLGAVVVIWIGRMFVRSSP